MSDTQQNDFEFDPETLAGAIASAPKAGFVNVSFGKMTLVAEWAKYGPEKNEKGKKVRHARAMKKGVTPLPGEKQELTIKVDVQEFNPQLEWSYARTCFIQDSDPAKGALSDWAEITLPSFKAVMGEDWLIKAMAHPYVQIEDVPSVNPPRDANSKRMSCPKLIAVYPNVAACAKAREERFANVGGESDGTGVKEAAVLQTKALLKAVGGDPAVAKPLMGVPPYNAFDADELIMLAQV